MCIRDSIFTYSENGWEHSTMDSFKNYKRTISHGTEGAYFLSLIHISINNIDFTDVIKDVLGVNGESSDEKTN